MPNDPNMKSKRKVRRLHDVEVSHVSLVDRPANKTPFKFVKRDGSLETEGSFPMNHMLKTMFGSRKPEIVSVIADAEAKAIAVAKMLLAEGEIEVTNTDGVFVARAKGSQPSADERVIHLGKAAGVAYTVAHLTKELSLYDMDGTDFDETVKQEGFVPGLMVGMEALHTTIRNIAMSEDTKTADAFRAGVMKAVDQFADYLDSLITSLPEKAFKFEKALVAVAPSPIGAPRSTPEGFNSEVYDAIFGKPVEGAVTDAPAEAAQTPASPATADAPAEPAAAAPAPAEASAATAPAEPAAAAAPATPATPAAPAAPTDAAPANLVELPKGTTETYVTADQMKQALEGALGELVKSVGTTIADALKPVTEKVAATDAALQTLSKTVGSTVAGTPEVDAPPNVVTLTKSGGGGEPPLLDTAYRVGNRG